MTRPPLFELYLSRIKEFVREPARVFWVYGFPTVLAVVLGLAFGSRRQQVLAVDVVANGYEAEVVQLLEAEPGAGRPGRPAFDVRTGPAERLDRRLKTGKSALLVTVGADGNPTYGYDSSRADALAARDAVDDRIQRARGRVDAVPVVDELVTEPGSRYIDFLIPGLIGMNTMGGGMWGIGFLLVHFRKTGLLKRFRATPMPRRDFLLAILGARLTWMIPDLFVLLGMGVLLFQMPVRGSLLLLLLVTFCGTAAFAGIGLLVASRARNTESVNGLMNLVMMPMWLFSGVFFSYERFPEWMHPAIRALPLTQLLDGLRAVILEGAGFVELIPCLAILLAYAVVGFAVALRIFRWT